MKKIFILSLTIFTTKANFAQAPFTKISTGAAVTDGNSSFAPVLFDMDNDGDLDLFVANYYSENDLLYINNGGVFSSVASSVVKTDGKSTVGATVGDYNNDGYTDLFVSGFVSGTNDLLYKNSASGFTSVLTSVVDSDGATSNSPSWVDYDNDGYLDLFVPTKEKGNLLYQNNQNGTFSRNTTTAFVSESGYFLQGAWADFDNDGDQDLFVPNVTGLNLFYRNDGAGVFTKMTSSIISQEGYSNGGSWGDYDNDGDFDLIVTNGDNSNFKTNFFYTNNGNGTFTKNTSTTLTTEQDVFAGSSWADYDNDGDLDIYITHPSVQSSSGPNYLFQNNGDGSFTKVVTGTLVTDASKGRGISWGDIDKDGDLDLFIANELSTNNWLYTNIGNNNHWVQFNLVGDSSNKSAIGARVKIKTSRKGTSTWQIREIAGQTGYCSQNALTVHFGLGTVSCIDSVAVLWPSGIKSYFTNVATNKYYTVNEKAINNLNNTCATGINSTENDGETRVSLYPNPTSSLLTIDASGEKVENVSVINTNGQIVAKFSSLANNQINISDLSNGLYFIEIEVKGKTIRKTFAKAQ